MLTKFALISELLTINQNKYVVRVMVVSQGETVASGLAAAETVEIAEDRARERAVALINSNFNFNFSSPESGISSTSFAEKETVEELPSKFQTDTHNPNVVELSKSYSNNKSNSKQSSLEAKESSVSNKYKSPSQKITSSSPLPKKSKNNNANDDGVEKKEFTPKAKKNLESSYEQQSQDLIQKTNMEIQRLGWTEEKGKNYLLKTYGKKVRKHLTYQELTEFYHYLQSQ